MYKFKTNKLIYKIMAWIPAVIIATCIFSFSMQNGEQSSSLSNKAASFLINVSKDLRIIETSTDTHQKYIDELQLPIRKCAHMTEYMIFTFSVMFALYVWGERNRSLYLKTFMIVAIFASTDEFHQLFVAGRSAKITDVLIDSIGAVIGIFIVWYVYQIKSNHKQIIKK